uniref:Cytochrome c oxidase subunit 3 n=2 Tax=Callitettix TaxID=533007 RepID=A0A343KGH8_9HEMI|nr:cytochrome c oxidase subunit III [Callitettix versicolor]ACD77282.1 cytochrome c oxidase subunit III [Callitettix versicolor]ATF28570.1 cytochrome c oxidase subunit III [Callitettix sp.EMHAU-15090607]
MKKNHPFHLVDKSPWPITGSIGVMTLTSGTVMMFQKTSFNLLMMGMIIIMMTMYQWWRDITRESTMQGMHTLTVTKMMKMGMIMFIISEILFFTSFFWSFFHSSLVPTVEIGMNWPPKSIITFNPMQIPLLNTMILLSSGITITWAHHSLLKKNHSQTTQALMLTIMLGMYFSMLQGYEYYKAPFSIADSIYGSTFFMATGFHGLHVLIGTTFIMITTMRHMMFHFSNIHHFGFEAAAWYWHFVDLVWLFLYISIYWWGS